MTDAEIDLLEETLVFLQCAYSDERSAKNKLEEKAKLVLAERAPEGEKAAYVEYHRARLALPKVVSCIVANALSEYGEREASK